jgi:hypothetical protein
MPDNDLLDSDPSPRLTLVMRRDDAVAIPLDFYHGLAFEARRDRRLRVRNRLDIDGTR